MIPKTIPEMERILETEPELSDREIHRRTGWGRSWIRTSRIRIKPRRSPL